jgi:hypothetical protein
MPAKDMSADGFSAEEMFVEETSIAEMTCCHFF